jgi:bifunctional UDP-N-acetylglucosamine pyrophosphorylase/glucosamine-1-phosphate N-acetyltransferase
MLLYVLDGLRDCAVRRAIVVVGHGAERVTKKLQEHQPELLLDFVEQHRQRGTGDAVSVGLTGFSDDEIDTSDGDVLVLPGDTPLLRPATVAGLVDVHRRTDAACTVLTAHMPEPRGYGRIIRGKEGRVNRIVEEADATPEERAVDEVNTAIYCFRLNVLAPALRRLHPTNAQCEYYLTDVIEVLHDAGYQVAALAAEDHRDTQGVNDRLQLSVAEAELRRRTNENLLRQGVTMVDPARTYIDTTVRIAGDVTIFPGSVLQGRTTIGAGAEIGPDTRLIDCAIGEGAVLEKTSGREARVGRGATVGPFAVLEPGSQVAAGARTGPFYTAGAADDARA